MKHEINEQELATILAALRTYQGRAYPSNEILEIATDGGEHTPLSENDIDELCERLNGSPQEGDEIYLKWTITDVSRYAEGIEIHLSVTECRAILKRVYEQHNAHEGVNWLTIETLIDQHLIDDIDAMHRAN